MYAKINISCEKFKTEKAKLFVGVNNNEFWIPKYIIKHQADSFIAIDRNFAKKNNFEYTEISLSQLIDKNLKPLKHLILPNCGGYLPEKAMRHQELAFKFASGLKSVALFMDMGTGKSKLYIDLADYHYKNKSIDNVIFFAPVTTLDNFKNELLKWKNTNLKWELKSINYLSKSPLNEEIVDFISKITPKTLIVIDESHRIKTLDSNTSKNAFIMGKKTDFKIIGTGTPSPNSAIDLLGQFRFLTPQEFPETNNQLKKRWQKIGNKGVLQGCKDEVGLVSKTNVYTFSVKKEDCLDLPSINYIKIKKESKILNEHIENYRAEINQKFLEDTGTVMGYLQNLRKLATGRDLERNIVVKNPRIEILKDILEDIFDKTIIWHSFYNEIEDIAEVLDGDYVLLNGHMGENERIHNISEFKKNPKIKYLIATAAVGGVGLNFTEAKNNIYFSHSFNLIDRLQSLSRSHRIGQNDNVNIFDIIINKTIDNRIIDSLERKTDFLNEVTDIYKTKGKAQVIDYFTKIIK
jgi:SNF2 family DNA or RNA helicase